MKSNYRIAGSVMLALSALWILISSFYGDNHIKMASSESEMRNLQRVLSDSLPAEIHEVLSTSCLNCHATGGKALAMAKLNFSEWNNYDPEKQVKKAEAICEKLSKGSMPPKSFVRDHPDKVPTAEQLDIICKWTENLKSGGKEAAAVGGGSK